MKGKEVAEKIFTHHIETKFRSIRGAQEKRGEGGGRRSGEKTLTRLGGTRAARVT